MDDEPQMSRAKERKIFKRHTDSAIGMDDDPQIRGAYDSDIYEYLHEMEMEAKRRPLSDYLEKIQNGGVSADMRGLVIDRLVEVAEEHNLLPDILYLTVSYFDRFLSTTVFLWRHLPLLGVSSMLIAS